MRLTKTDVFINIFGTCSLISICAIWAGIFLYPAEWADLLLWGGFYFGLASFVPALVIALCWDRYD